MSGPFPRQYLRNQFGEKSLNTMEGGGGVIDINFIVDHANGNGLGIRSLKSSVPGIPVSELVSNVFMNTSASPAAGNPNPIAGLIMVQLAVNYLGYVGGYWGAGSPLAGSALTSVTEGHAYVITSLGTTTTAQWVAAGLAIGAVPTVGQAFIAIASGSIGGTGTVEVPGVSGMGNLEVVGDPNQLVAATGGSILILQALAPTSSSVTTPVPTAPADNSVIGLRFVMLGGGPEV
jgi:hypothetical protein